MPKYRIGGGILSEEPVLGKGFPLSGLHNRENFTLLDLPSIIFHLKYRLTSLLTGLHNQLVERSVVRCRLFFMWTISLAAVRTVP